MNINYFYTEECSICDDCWKRLKEVMDKEDSDND